MYVAPGEDIAFGDIFRRDSVYHDAHLQADVSNLGFYGVPPGYSPRFAKGIANKLNRIVEVPASGMFPIYSPERSLSASESMHFSHMVCRRMPS